MTDRLPTSAILVGQRHRRDFGNLDELARSIDDLGLLHPVVVKPDGLLICGERRLRAWALTPAGRAGEPIPVRVVDVRSVLRGEAAENGQRKNWMPSEAVGIARDIEAEIAAAAQARRLAHLKQGDQLPEVETFHHGENGKTRDLIAVGLGLSGRSLDKARAVVEAGEEDPDRFAPLVEDMDRSGRINGPYNRLLVARKADAIKASPPPVPGLGPYFVSVLDVPWAYEIRTEDSSHRAVLPYPTLSLDQIRALGPMVQELMHEDGVLWFWTTNTFIEEACQVVREWGFEKKTVLTWGKNTFKMGTWLRGQTEHCLQAVRGRATVTLTNESTLLLAPSPRLHSAKPDEFYELVESLCPAPRYLEFFQRKARPNWDGYGDEAAVWGPAEEESAA